MTEGERLLSKPAQLGPMSVARGQTDAGRVRLVILLVLFAHGCSLMVGDDASSTADAAATSPIVVRSREDIAGVGDAEIVLSVDSEPDQLLAIAVGAGSASLGTWVTVDQALATRVASYGVVGGAPTVELWTHPSPAGGEVLVRASLFTTEAQHPIVLGVAVLSGVDTVAPIRDDQGGSANTASPSVTVTASTDHLVLAFFVTTGEDDLALPRSLAELWDETSTGSDNDRIQALGATGATYEDEVVLTAQLPSAQLTTAAAVSFVPTSSR